MLNVQEPNLRKAGGLVLPLLPGLVLLLLVGSDTVLPSLACS
jgi:hypothetical protein